MNGKRRALWAAGLFLCSSFSVFAETKKLQDVGRRGQIPTNLFQWK
jgi:hypothetical protein